MITQEEVRPPGGTVETPAAPSPVITDEIETALGETEPLKEKSTLARIAAVAQRMAQQVREEGVRKAAEDLMNEAGNRLLATVRRKPAATLGAAAVTGFVTGRLLRGIFRSKRRRECQ